MKDLHTHILPGMDDGSKNVEMSLQMLRMEAEQGVDTVGLTSHFYRDSERPSSFFRRRAAAWEELQEAIASLPREEQDRLPELLLASEVAWVPNISDWDELREFCYTDTTEMLIELPFFPWDNRVFNELYDLMNRTGITPIIAHIDRYWGGQKEDAIRELLSLGLPVQLSASAFLHFSTRGRAIKLMKHSDNCFLITDCHNITSRPPNMKAAVDILNKKLHR